ncbi:MAG: mechanosensitive ion channel domain-containing protein [Pseudomonadota bacterium]
MNESMLILGIPIDTLIACVLVIALLAVAHVGLRLWAARRHRREAALAGAASGAISFGQWLAYTIIGLVSPIALLLWIHGLHFALTMILEDVPYPRFARYGMMVLDGLRGIGSLLGLMWVLARVGRGLERWLVRVALHTKGTADDLFLPIVGTAIRLLLPLLALILGTPMLAVPDRIQAMFRNGVSMVLIGVFAYILYRLIDAACQLVLSRHRIDVADNREARGVYTQVTVLRKVALSVIGTFALASMLMVFDSVRQLGTTILASAGVAGIVVGFAAQRSLGALLGGFQIAMTQPIRIDDVVVVENEWGKIEEITLTYVVINLWDQRRLVVPTTYFLEKTFQNWTRTSADLLASVFLYVDYQAPIERVRQQLTRILEASELWDRKVNALQVTDTTEHAVQIRALASAADASRAWDLRCEMREKLIRFLQQEQPDSLPRLRLAKTALHFVQQRT